MSGHFKGDFNVERDCWQPSFYSKKISQIVDLSQNFDRKSQRPLAPYCQAEWNKDPPV